MVTLHDSATTVLGRMESPGSTDSLCEVAVGDPCRAPTASWSAYAPRVLLRSDPGASSGTESEALRDQGRDVPCDHHVSHVRERDDLHGDPCSDGFGDHAGGLVVRRAVPESQAEVGTQ